MSSTGSTQHIRVELGARVVSAARGYLGCPFQHQGRSRDGLDCVGLVVLVAQDLGLDITDFRRYSRSPNPRVLLREISERMDPVQAGEQLEGDVAAFWFHRERRREGLEIPQHVGILSMHPTGAPAVIHTHARVGKVVETIMGGEWSNQVHTWWRYRWGSPQ